MGSISLINTSLLLIISEEGGYLSTDSMTSDWLLIGLNPGFFSVRNDLFENNSIYDEFVGKFNLNEQPQK